MASQKCIIVDSLPACKSAVRDLEREHVVAIDAEGINLSLTGPLTLLQIGTTSQNVYLFDVQSERQMFEHGGLKAFLAKESIVKVYSRHFLFTLSFLHVFSYLLMLCVLVSHLLQQNVSW